jgi:hypothetical protein
MASRSPCSFIDAQGPVTIEAGGATEIRSFDAKTCARRRACGF